MFPLKQPKKIYFYTGKVDFRKSINGLCVIIEHELKYDPFEEAWFVFISRNKKKLKLVYWRQARFSLWYYRLEKQRFRLPKSCRDDILHFSEKEFEIFLDGFDIFRMQPAEDFFRALLSTGANIDQTKSFVWNR